jgi:hypothetical protein
MGRNNNRTNTGIDTLNSMFTPEAKSKPERRRSSVQERFDELMERAQENFSRAYRSFSLPITKSKAKVYADAPA